MATLPRNVQSTGPSPLEIDRINLTILKLNKAKKAEDETSLVACLQEAYKHSRTLVRGRLD